MCVAQVKRDGKVGKFGKVELSDIDDFAILPDGKVLSASEAGYLLMWEGNFIKYRLARPGGVACHAGKVTHVSLLRSKLGNGVAFMSAGTDGKLCWWDFEEIDGAEIDMDKGIDYEIDLQHGKKPYETGDRADRPLFKWVDQDVLSRPTWASFIALLDNYEASEGKAERVTRAEIKEESDFLDLNLKMPCLRYVLNADM